MKPWCGERTYPAHYGRDRVERGVCPRRLGGSRCEYVGRAGQIGDAVIGGPGDTDMVALGWAKAKV